MAALQSIESYGLARLKDRNEPADEYYGLDRGMAQPWADIENLAKESQSFLTYDPNPADKEAALEFNITMNAAEQTFVVLTAFLMDQDTHVRWTEMRACKYLPSVMLQERDV